MLRLKFFHFTALLLITSSPAFALDEVDDPIEPFNRAVFWFNDTLDVNLIGPVSRGYDDITPDGVQRRVGNFFDNLRYPQYLLSDVVQFKFTQAAEHTGRFLINSTIGLAGIFDVATDMGLEKHTEDFGLALAYHGVPPGPYLVLPFLGPSNLRDAFGKLFDFAVHPFMIIEWAGAPAGVSDRTWLLRMVEFINERASLEEAIKTAKASSVDYYLFLQGAYYQYRLGQLYDGNPPDDDEFEPEPEKSN